MKKITLLFLLAFGSLQAQTITLAESFKQALLNNPTTIVDANYEWVNLDPDGDGEILLADALRVTEMVINDPSLTDVTGLSAFANLGWVSFADSGITSIDLSGLPLLYNIWLDNNPLTSLNIQNMPALQSVYASTTGITTLEVANCPLVHTIWASYCANLTTSTTSGLPQLSSLSLDHNPALLSVDASNCPLLEFWGFGNSPAVEHLNLSGALNTTDLGELRLQQALKTLDVSHCTNLSVLWLEYSDNALESIDMTDCPAMRNLILSDTQLTSVDFSGVPNLTYLIIGGPMTHLDFSPLVSTTPPPLVQIMPGNVETVIAGPYVYGLYIGQNNITSLDLSDATALREISIANNPITYLNLKNGAVETMTEINNFTLQYVCADEEQVAQIQALVPASVTVSSYCSFVPGGDYNTVSGHLRLDSDFNGCSPSDFAPQYVRVDISDGNTTQFTYTYDGFYKFFPLTGSYTVTPILHNPALYTLTPPNAAFDFPTLNQAATQDFCIVPNNFDPDLEIVLTPLGTARPGFNSIYKLVYRNKGNVTLSGNVNFTFDEATADFVSAAPTASSLQSGVAQFSFSNLRPLETRAITVTLNLNGPTETPPLNSGSIVTTTAAIDISESELTPADNTFTLHQIAVNSYDPNDKTCLEGATLSPEKIGEYLHYNINFENIGSAEAINVVVRDVIDASMFDINSLQLLYASHPVYTRVNGNNVEFIFEGINLPPSSLDPIGGHGNVLFKIKTLNTLQTGDAVTNTANIYFDYNHPVETNQARTAFETLGKTVFTKDSSISLHPNPAQHTVQISADNQIKSVELFDIQGRILQHSAHTSAQATLDIANRSLGVYFVRVTTQNGSQVLKLVKS